MNVAYRVYGNGGTGGPIDYSTPIQDSPSALFAMPGASPGSWSFGVRAYDVDTGLEEKNTDAVASIVIGADGSDRTKVPNSPACLTARAVAGGCCRASFLYPAPGQAGPPTRFEAWLWPASSPPDWTIPPAATLEFTFFARDPSRYISITIGGLVAGSAYRVGVRAANATGDDGNTTTVGVVGAPTPSTVGGLASSAGYPT